MTPGTKQAKPIHRPEGDSNRAKQTAILLADIEHAARWLSTVRELVAQDLAYTEFISAYMTALKSSERDRKRAQGLLHWHYGPSRRRPDLIARDTRRMLKRRAQLDAALQAFTDANPELASIDISSPPSPDAALPHRGHNTRDLTAIDPAFIAMVTNDTGLDLTTASDKDVFDAYRLRGLTEQDAIHYVRTLKGLS